MCGGLDTNFSYRAPWPIKILKPPEASRGKKSNLKFSLQFKSPYPQPVHSLLGVRVPCLVLGLWIWLGWLKNIHVAPRDPVGSQSDRISCLYRGEKAGSEGEIWYKAALKGLWEHRLLCSWEVGKPLFISWGKNQSWVGGEWDKNTI